MTRRMIRRTIRFLWIFGEILINISCGLASSEGLIAYNCTDSTEVLEVYDLTSTRQCTPVKNTKGPIHQEVQILQYNSRKPLNYRRCLVIISRTIFNCNWDQEVSPVLGGHYEYIKPISNEGCLQLHLSKQYDLNNNVITDIPVNRAISTPIILAGSLESDGW